MGPTGKSLKIWNILTGEKWDEVSKQSGLAKFGL